jgi:Zn-dependent M32 family carboxypeptidase
LWILIAVSVEKNTAGVNIKAYELPGLWNGAMANWLTVF